MSGSDEQTYAVAFSQALSQCANADATVATCFPTNDTTVYEGQFVDLVWNPRYSSFAQSDLLDIHLFRDIGSEQVGVWEAIGVANPSAGNAGVKHLQVNSTWFNSEWHDIDLNDPFYFTIAPSGTVPQQQAWFRAVQTGPVAISSTAPTASSTAVSSVAGNSSTSDSHVSAGTIAGAVVGCSAALVLVGLGAWLLRRRRRAAARKAVKINLGSDTNSDTHSISSEVDEKAAVREMSRV